MELLFFPDEVLLCIFGQNALSIEDLFSLTVTCKRFCSIIKYSNELWKGKLLLRWPNLRSIKGPQRSWRDLVLLRMKSGLHVWKLLKELSPRCYAEIEPPVNMMDNIITPNQTFQGLGSDIYSCFVEDELMDIIFHKNHDRHLTIKYYAKKILRYLRTTKLDKTWEEFLGRPTSEQSLIEGALLVSQWGQMESAELPSFQTVVTLIEEIVEQVKKKLKTMELSSINIACNNPAEPKNARKILACINQVLYTELGFHGNIENYHSFENSYIDQVLKSRKGIPITLCIIYHEVAKRVGVNCEPVSFPQHFLLRWNEFPEEGEANQFTYIDAFNTGSFHLSHSCPALIGRSREEVHRDAYSTVSPAQVFQRMANNLIQSCRILGNNGQSDSSGLRTQVSFTRLACAISRRHPQLVVGYAELCFHPGTQLEEAIELLQVAGTESPPSDDPPVHWARIRQITSMKCANRLSYQRAQQAKHLMVRRNPSIKFTVGLIMLHKIYGYTCVIVFWDPTCQATEEWIQRMGVNSLKRGKNQPFYHVLVEDGSCRYAAEENLELHPEGKFIDHPDVGVHFERYDGRRYIPNAEKFAHYPDDEEVARALLK